MSIAPTEAGTAAAAAFQVELPGALSLGQIVKARVLKHYEGGRYLVSLEGRERVVDSSVPLNTGELVRGRVIAVGERIELQPLPESLPTPQDPVAAQPTDELASVFAQYGLKLDADPASLKGRVHRMGAVDVKFAVVDDLLSADLDFGMLVPKSLREKIRSELSKRLGSLFS